MRYFLEELFHTLGPLVLMALWLGLGYGVVRALMAPGWWKLLGVVATIAFALPIGLAILAIFGIWQTWGGGHG